MTSDSSAIFYDFIKRFNRMTTLLGPQKQLYRLTPVRGAITQLRDKLALNTSTRDPLEVLEEIANNKEGDGVVTNNGIDRYQVLWNRSIQKTFVTEFNEVDKAIHRFEPPIESDQESSRDEEPSLC